MDEADGEGKERGVEVADHWREVEGWRRERRQDTGLRKRTLGF
jgi:hypothetical protein